MPLQMLGQNKPEQGRLNLEDAAAGSSLSTWRKRCQGCGLPTVLAHRGSDGTQAVGSRHCNSV